MSSRGPGRGIDDEISTGDKMRNAGSRSHAFLWVSVTPERVHDTPNLNRATVSEFYKLEFCSKVSMLETVNTGQITGTMLKL